jgi:hypothetical protein
MNAHYWSRTEVVEHEDNGYLDQQHLLYNEYVTEGLFSAFPKRPLGGVWQVSSSCEPADKANTLKQVVWVLEALRDSLGCYHFFFLVLEEESNMVDLSMTLTTLGLTFQISTIQKLSYICQYANSPHRGSISPSIKAVTMLNPAWQWTLMTFWIPNINILDHLFGMSSVVPNFLLCDMDTNTCILLPNKLLKKIVISRHWLWYTLMYESRR